MNWIRLAMGILYCSIAVFADGIQQPATSQDVVFALGVLVLYSAIDSGRKQS